MPVSVPRADPVNDTGDPNSILVRHRKFLKELEKQK
jgi:hypothetical protein